MADQSPYPYPSPTTQLEQLAGAAQQASPPSGAEFATPSQQRPPNPRKRRADGSSVSNRGVANLTPEQLAKKRANDREAQRAIRERTRNTIENLERRIKELEGQQPFQELQTVVRSRDAVIAENEELKKRLQSIAALTQFQSGGHGLNDLALATAQQAPLPLPGQQSQQQQSGFHQAYGHDEGASLSQQHIHPDLRSLQNGSGKGDLSNWERTPVHFALDPHGLDPGPASELDFALQNLVNSRRSALNSGAAPDTVLGPAQPSFSALVSTAAGSEEPDVSSPLPTEVANLVNQHLASADLPKRVATMYITYLLVRWMAAPSEASFARLPDWLRPTHLQLDRPHAAWVDLLPWPQSRDRAISGAAHFYSTFSSIGMAWPYDPELCLIKTSSEELEAEEEQWAINPVFEAHVRVLEHWTVAAQAGSDRDEGLEGLLQGLEREAGAQ